MWNTLDLLPAAAVPAGYRSQVQQTPPNRSFMHLHLGFDGAGEDAHILYSLQINIDQTLARPASPTTLPACCPLVAARMDLLV